MSKEFVKYKLPKNWIWTTIGELGIVASGGTPSTRERRYWDGDTPWITPADLTNYKDKYISSGRRFITEDGLEESSAKLLPKGTILFSSRAPIGYVAIAKNEIATNQGFKNLILTKWTNPDYIFYYLKSAKQLAQNMASGTTFLELSASKFSQMPIPLPSFIDQGNIVAKLDELFSEIDNGLNNFVLAQNQLKVYKGSILKSAFEGELTKEWRNLNNLESVKNLKDTIIKKRKKQYEIDLKVWEENVKAWEENGKKSKKPKKPNMVKLESVDNNLNLPKSWFVTNFKSSVCNYGENRIPLSSNERSKRQGKYPYYGATGIIDYLDNYIFSGEYLLIGEDGANLLSKSKDLAFIVNDKFWVNNHAHVVKPLEGLKIKFLCFYFNSLTLNEYVSGTAQPKLSQANLNRIPIPYCCEEEQDIIILQLESQLSNLIHLEEILITNIEKLKALRQSILKKAFEGRLVKSGLSNKSVLEEYQGIKEEKKKYFEQEKTQKKNKPKKIIKMDKSLSIEDILKTSSTPISAKEVWESSKHKDDIEAFYAELKKLQGKVKEVEKGMLTLTNES